MTSPSKIRALLAQLGKRPSKRLSQNFLIDNNILLKVLNIANVQKGDTVLEVGPGLGSLTEALLQRGATVYAVEKDSHLFAHLKELQALYPNLYLFEGDILSFPLEKTIPDKAKVVANIPYQITAPLLGCLLPLHRHLDTLTLFMQDEVAKRVIAKPSTKDYSALTLFTHLYSTPKYAFKVGRRCFYPPPKVDSAVVTFALMSPPKNVEGVRALVRQAFNQKRKRLTTSLATLFPKERIKEGLHTLGISDHAHPQELSLEAFIALEELLSPFKICYK